ncbi:MAG: BON domain-containing protein [Rhodocyclaceae bacterium]|nr:BON domain-containing protein [Rhodocyclaceae bacterium]
MKSPICRTTLVTTAAAALLLAACGAENETVAAKDAEVLAESKADMAAAGDAIERGAERAGKALKESIADAGQVVEDAAITTAVKAELIHDERIDALAIDVDTQDGEVTLTGTAPDAAARDQAERVAAAVTGVKVVHNKLAVADS